MTSGRSLRPRPRVLHASEAGESVPGSRSALSGLFGTFPALQLWAPSRPSPLSGPSGVVCSLQVKGPRSPAPGAALRERGTEVLRGHEVHAAPQDPRLGVKRSSPGREAGTEGGRGFVTPSYRPLGTVLSPQVLKASACP